MWKDVASQTTDEAFDGLLSTPYELEEAKKLVKEAGAEGSKFVFATASLNAAFDITARAIASAAKEIGLDPEIQTMSNDKYTTLFSDPPESRKNVDLLVTSWYLSSTEPLEMYSVLRTGDFSNYGGWSNPEFDDLVNSAYGVQDPRRPGGQTDGPGGQAGQRRSGVGGRSMRPSRPCGWANASPGGRTLPSTTCTSRGQPR